MSPPCSCRREWEGAGSLLPPHGVGGALAIRSAITPRLEGLRKGLPDLNPCSQRFYRGPPLFSRACSWWGGLSLRGGAQMGRVGICRWGYKIFDRGPPLFGTVCGRYGTNLSMDYLL